MCIAPARFGSPSGASASISSATALPRSTSPCQMASRPAPQSGVEAKLRVALPAGCKCRIEPATALAPVATNPPEMPDLSARSAVRRRCVRVRARRRGRRGCCRAPLRSGRTRSTSSGPAARGLASSASSRKYGAVPLAAGPRRRRSPRARSSANSRIVSSIQKRSSVWRTRLFSTSDCNVSRSASQTRRGRFQACSRRRTRRAWRTAASPRRSRAGRSSIRSWPAASAAAPRHLVHPSSRSRRCASRSRIWPGERTLVRAAASSTASGRLSSRRQSSAISSLGSEPGAGAEELDRLGAPPAAPPDTRPRPGHATAPGSSPRGEGSGRTRAATRSSGAASTTCSKLSSSRSSSRSPMCSARPSLAPNVCATVSATRAGSRRVARPIQKTPFLNSGTQLGRRLDRQPRLPRTARAGQRHQPRAILQQLDHVRHLPLPAHERRRRPRQIRVRDRLQRRKALRRPAGRSRPVPRSPSPGARQDPPALRRRARASPCETSTWPP